MFFFHIVYQQCFPCRWVYGIIKKTVVSDGDGNMIWCKVEQMLYLLVINKGRKIYALPMANRFQKCLLLDLDWETAILFLLQKNKH